MNSKLKRKRKTFLAQGKSLTSAEFGDFASYSLLLFSMWSRVFVFVCILSPPQRFPLGIPIKISKIEKIESARGTCFEYVHCKCKEEVQC